MSAARLLSSGAGWHLGIEGLRMDGMRDLHRGSSTGQSVNQTLAG